MTFRAIDVALNAVWAMEPAALDTLLTIAARDHETTPEALEAYAAKTLAGAQRAQVRDGVAIISATGAMFKRANLFSAISGATSYDVMRLDLQTALDDPKVRAILINMDSPGGEASGAGELAAAIHAARGVKPIKAYVNGMGASAGYWIIAGASEVIVDPQAILGSIGVQMAMTKRDEPKGATSYTFISSQSPMKNSDPGSEEGAAHIQGVVDAMAQVFVEAVATYRGVATETVLNDFGKGGIFVGQDAVKAGLADRIGNFEGVLAELSATRRGRSKGATMSDETFTAEQRDTAVAAARAAEKVRVANLRKLAAAHAVTDADLTAAIDGDVTVEAFALSLADKATAKAAAASAAAQAAEATRLAALKTDEEAAAKAAASKGSEPEGETLDAVAARIAAA